MCVHAKKKRPWVKFSPELRFNFHSIVCFPVFPKLRIHLPRMLGDQNDEEQCVCVNVDKYGWTLLSYYCSRLSMTRSNKAHKPHHPTLRRGIHYIRKTWLQFGNTSEFPKLTPCWPTMEKHPRPSPELWVSCGTWKRPPPFCCARLHLVYSCVHAGRICQGTGRF